MLAEACEVNADMHDVRDVPRDAGTAIIYLDRDAQAEESGELRASACCRFESKRRF